MSEAAPHLLIEALVKRFAPGQAAAVDGVSLAIEKGEFFALLGPSGCGKTTLLRMLAGFEVPDEGRVLIDGADMARVPPYARPTNMMFQSYALFPHLTVERNVGFGLRQDGVAKEEIGRRVASMLDLVKLGRHAARKPHQLSGGERQRVALARALIKEPKLLLLDEPLTALDRKLREDTRGELVRIQRSVGITFLMVTHDQEEAMSMATRIAVMSQGKIAQMGPPASVYESPANRFVAGFLGSVNLLEGRVKGAEGGTVLIESPEAGGVLTTLSSSDTIPGREVWVAVRPEKITLSREESAATPNRFAGRVRASAYRGEVSTLEIALASGKTMRVLLPNSARESGTGFSYDEPVWLSFPPQAGVVLTQ